MTTASDRLCFRDVGRMGYGDAVRLQESILAARVAGSAPDTLLLLEHPPVFTLGRNADHSNVLWDSERRRREGVELVETGRGGDVTYHGPGQLVGYPVLGLAARGMGVLEFVTRLEQCIVRTLAEFGIAGEGGRRDRGVWVGNAKIAALGVRVTRGVSMHGFALNVCTDLAPFRGIIPCGLHDCGVTSMVECLSRPVRVDEVKRTLLPAFCAAFDYRGYDPAGRLPCP